jgi:hypothetical protein
MGYRKDGFSDEKASALAMLFVHWGHLTGFSSEEAAYPVLSSQTRIDIRGLALGGIIIFNNCGEQVEMLVRSETSGPPACPNCGSTLPEKLFSVPHVMTGRGRPAGQTCCGREERCETPPCSGERTCWSEL